MLPKVIANIVFEYTDFTIANDFGNFYVNGSSPMLRLLDCDEYYKRRAVEIYCTAKDGKLECCTAKDGKLDVDQMGKTYDSAAIINDTKFAHSMFDAYPNWYSTWICKSEWVHKLAKKNTDKIDWCHLCMNEGYWVKDLLLKNLGKIDIWHLARNPARWVDEVIVAYLSQGAGQKHFVDYHIENPDRIIPQFSSIRLPWMKKILLTHPDKICGEFLSCNSANWVKDVLLKYPDKIDKYALSCNSAGWVKDVLYKHPLKIQTEALFDNNAEWSSEILADFWENEDLKYELIAHPERITKEHCLSVYSWMQDVLLAHSDKICDDIAQNTASWVQKVLMAHPDKIDPEYISENPAPWVCDVLMVYPEKIHRYLLFTNDFPWLRKIAEAHPEFGVEYYPDENVPFQEKLKKYVVSQIAQ